LANDAFGPRTTRDPAASYRWYSFQKNRTATTSTRTTSGSPRGYRKANRNPRAITGTTTPAENAMSADSDRTVPTFRIRTARRTVARAGARIRKPIIGRPAYASTGGTTMKAGNAESPRAKNHRGDSRGGPT
jgi:hypothetical protein